MKPEPNPPNYRKFPVDTRPPLEEPPELTSTAPVADWRQLRREYEKIHGKKLKPIQRRGKAKKLPDRYRCAHCNAPSDFLYLNNGKLNSQVACKVCDRTSSTNRVRTESKAKYWCPYCGYALFKWKERTVDTVFKCPNNQCSHYLAHLKALTSEERAMIHEQKYNPNFKLHYQFRENRIDLNELKPARPEIASKVDLRKIHHNLYVVALVLTYSINLGLSSRQTVEALKRIHGIAKISHQTVLNYLEAVAGMIYEWVDERTPLPKGKAAADETYIIVKNQWHYTWFIIDSETRAICGYNLSDNRGTEPALALLCSTFGKPEACKEGIELITDGLPSYDNAVMAYNQEAKKTPEKQDPLTKHTVIGLENLDPESKEYRQFKQLVERLNRTYKFHTRPRASFKSFNGLTILTTLFVAFYNFMRPHSAKKDRPPVSIEELENVQLYPEMWLRVLKAS